MPSPSGRRERVDPQRLGQAAGPHERPSGLPGGNGAGVVQHRDRVHHLLPRMARQADEGFNVEHGLGVGVRVGPCAEHVQPSIAAEGRGKAHGIAEYEHVGPVVVYDTGGALVGFDQAVSPLEEVETPLIVLVIVGYDARKQKLVLHRLHGRLFIILGGQRGLQHHEVVLDFAVEEARLHARHILHNAHEPLVFLVLPSGDPGMKRVVVNAVAQAGELRLGVGSQDDVAVQPEFIAFFETAVGAEAHFPTLAHGEVEYLDFGGVQFAVRLKTVESLVGIPFELLTASVIQLEGVNPPLRVRPQPHAQPIRIPAARHGEGEFGLCDRLAAERPRAPQRILAGLEQAGVDPNHRWRGFAGGQRLRGRLNAHNVAQRNPQKPLRHGCGGIVPHFQLNTRGFIAEPCMANALVCNGVHSTNCSWQKPVSPRTPKHSRRRAAIQIRFQDGQGKPRYSSSSSSMQTPSGPRSRESAPSATG